MAPSIEEFLSENRHDLIILAHPDIRELERICEALSGANGWPTLSIGRALSAEMIAGQVSGPPAIQTWLADQVRGLAPGPVLVYGIDLLFEPSFKLDPLVLFQRASRLTRLVVLWPGTYSNHVLAYAVPKHQHYRTWRNPDAGIMNL